MGQWKQKLLIYVTSSYHKEKTIYSELKLLIVKDSNHFDKWMNLTFTTNSIQSNIHNILCEQHISECYNIVFCYNQPWNGRGITIGIFGWLICFEVLCFLSWFCCTSIIFYLGISRCWSFVSSCSVSLIILFVRNVSGPFKRVSCHS